MHVRNFKSLLYLISERKVFSLFVNFIFNSGSVGRHRTRERECCISFGTYRNWTILVYIFGC